MAIDCESNEFVGLFRALRLLVRLLAVTSGGINRRTQMPQIGRNKTARGSVVKVILFLNEIPGSWARSWELNGTKSSPLSSSPVYLHRDTSRRWLTIGCTLVCNCYRPVLDQCSHSACPFRKKFQLSDLLARVWSVAGVLWKRNPYWNRWSRTRSSVWKLQFWAVTGVPRQWYYLRWKKKTCSIYWEKTNHLLL